jgi:L-asparaginase
MKKILIISTGGTFNKVYDPLKGELLVDASSGAIKDIASKWLCKFEIMNIIGKDSLEMNSQDRLELLAMLSHSEYKDIIVVHGTDTMGLTAEYLAAVEATANLASAFGYLQTLNKSGVYIVMNGLFGSYEKVKKDREKGKFVLS